jgi:hypothetical protein
MRRSPARTDVTAARSPKLVRRSFIALGYGRVAKTPQAETVVDRADHAVNLLCGVIAFVYFFLSITN